MTVEPPDPVDVDDARQRALLGLLALGGAFGGRDPGQLPGFRPASPGANLKTLADAPEADVPVSARLQVLRQLARADFPHWESIETEYRALAASIGGARQVDPEQLLSDLKESARENVPFEATASGRALQHHDVAFLDEDVCTIRKVEVGGIRATWIYSEFETDAPFDQIVDWVDPRNWPQRGPLLFKRMALVGSQRPVNISALGDQHWHGVFHEEVNLVRRVNTLLHCDFWRDGDTAAGMTYELTLSLGGEIDVDRGFLSVNNIGDRRRVRALKIVGFTGEIWDDVAMMVCPFWTDWVRAAVQGGSASTPIPQSVPDPGGSRTPLEANLEAWVQFFGESARTYLDLFTTSSGRAAAGDTSSADWLADGTRYWTQLAKDWARAWTYGVEAVQEVAERGLDAGLAPPGKPAETARGVAAAVTAAVVTPAAAATTIGVPGLVPDDPLECSQLVSIEAGGATIPRSAVAAKVVALPDGSSAVRVETTDRIVRAGLYVGQLLDPTGKPVAPVQLYVSRAQEAGAS